MPAKHPEDVRLVAVAMARMVGAEQTADDLGLDVRTVKSWVAATPPRSDVTEDEEAWAAAEKVALYRNLRSLARGEVKDTIRLNNLAGTARDKLFRWAVRREARKEQAGCDCVLPPGWIPELHPKAGTPEHERAVYDIAAAKMSPARHTFMQDLRPVLAYSIDNEDGEAGIDLPGVREATAAVLEGFPTDTPGPLVGRLQQWIEGLDDDQLAARQALVDAAHRAYRDAIQAELQHRAYDPTGPATIQGLATRAEADMEPPPDRFEQPEQFSDATRISEAAPEPVERPTAPVVPIRRTEPAPMVLDAGYEDHDRGWHPYERREF